MPSTLSLSCSKKIYELLGRSDKTELYYNHQYGYLTSHEGDSIVASNGNVIDVNWGNIPAPSFSETIRLLPRIAEKKGWIYWVEEKDELENLEKLAEVTQGICWQYTKAKTEEEGMKQVSDYLEALL